MTAAAPTGGSSARTAVVTGASGGIGSAIAESLAERGDHLILIERGRSTLAETAARCVAAGGTIDMCAADLSDPDAVTALGDSLATRLDRLDVFVHAAGVHTTRQLPAPGDPTAVDAADLSAEAWVNQLAPQVLVHALAPALASAHGDVVLLGSSAPRFPRPTVGSYAGTKAALATWADSIRSELGPLGVRVLTVWPGRTATPMQAAILAEEQSSLTLQELLQPADIAATVRHAIELPPTAEITELHIRPAYPPSTKG